jgi:hypothetical protein
MNAAGTTAESARRALDAAKSDADFVRRYLDGDRDAFAYMQSLIRAAYPDEAPVGGGESGASAPDVAEVDRTSRWLPAAMGPRPPRQAGTPEMPPMATPRQPGASARQGSARRPGR